MERVEEHIGVDKEVSSFVLPVGATINMDGTSLYQGVAAVFAMQVLWPEGLVFSNQIIIVLTALLASIGSAAVPGAGMVMLVIVLESIGFSSGFISYSLGFDFCGGPAFGYVPYDRQCYWRCNGCHGGCQVCWKIRRASC